MLSDVRLACTAVAARSAGAIGRSTKAIREAQALGVLLLSAPVVSAKTASRAYTFVLNRWCCPPLIGVEEHRDVVTHEAARILAHRTWA